MEICHGKLIPSTVRGKRAGGARAPEILIMPPKKEEKQDKIEERCHINNSYATTEQRFSFSGGAVIYRRRGISGLSSLQRFRE